MVPHAEKVDTDCTATEPAALELGCKVNGIKHVVVCGHSDCKAMQLLHTVHKAGMTNFKIEIDKCFSLPLKKDCKLGNCNVLKKGLEIITICLDYFRSLGKGDPPSISNQSMDESVRVGDLMIIFFN